MDNNFSDDIVRPVLKRGQVFKHKKRWVMVVLDFSAKREDSAANAFSIKKVRFELAQEGTIIGLNRVIKVYDDYHQDLLDSLDSLRSIGGKKILRPIMDQLTDIFTFPAVKEAIFMMQNSPKANSKPDSKN